MSDLQSRLSAGLAGRYDLERELGQGGMALVFLARDIRHDRKVALKVLRPEIGVEIGAERFLREIKMAAGLTHPHILPVHDSGEAAGMLFYVMPNMEGRSLRERLDAEKQLSLEEALRITREVAGALDYAHRNRVIHRDIKPENILFQEGSAMVADFGIGKALSSTATVTQTGLAIGTPAYMSPEQASGEHEIDGRSDIYSLGCVLYEMLSGEPPFTGANAQAIMTKRFLSPAPHVKAVRDVPEGVDAIVTKALARAAVDRYATAAQFAEAIRATGQRTPTGSSPAPAKAAPAVKAIAVLPLANMSADPENEYFSDGMTEEIIGALSKVPGLQVASRTSCFSFKGKEVDIRQVGEMLGVGSVLTGSVRKVGNRIRITAQLVNAESGHSLWSETYDRQLEDVFAIQDEISRAIVEALKLRLAGGTGETAQVAAPTKNLEAYTLYLKGRFFSARVTEAGLHKGLEFFQHALLLDPGYAQAYAGIADCWCNLADDWVAPEDAYPRAKAAAQRALQREADLAEAITSVGKVLCWHEWDFAGAERQLERAVALSPNYAEAHFVLGTALPAVGRLGDAVDELRKAMALDPLSPDHSGWLSRFQLYARDFSGAIAQARKTIELDENYVRAYHYVGSAHLGQGDADKALEWFRRGQSMEKSVRSYDALIVLALAKLGRSDEAEEILTRLEEESKQHYVRSEILAMGYAAVGDFDKAFASLERAFQARSAGLIYLHVDPGYAPLRADARFGELVARIGLT